jgi:hypothetical protein
MDDDAEGLSPAQIEAKARAEYEAAREPGEAQIPWGDLPEFRRAYWREIAQGNAGASLG